MNSNIEVVSMTFKLFEELASLDAKGVLLLILGIAAAIAFAAVLLALRARRKKQGAASGTGMKKTDVRALVYGALCLSLSFVLSYFKLFELPMGGTVTLLSMLPVAAYAAMFGPVFGFTAALAYSFLQVVQGAYVVHWAQFLLDYTLGFTCLGLASLFPKKLPLGLTLAGFGRFVCSTLSGVIFFSAYAAEAGFQSAWLYSIAYNGSTIGTDTLLCVLVALLPSVRRLLERMKPAAEARV